MSDYKFMKLLKDKKVADAYQYFEASAYKLYLAELSYSALETVIAQYQENEKTYVEKVYEDALTTGKGAYKAHTNCIEYFGTQVSPTVMMDKLTMEIMSLLHNFFDTFAQWINASLFAEDGVPMERVSLPKVVSKLSSFPEYSGPFIATISTLTSSPEYEYVADFNNTLKHRRQIYVDNRFDVLAIKGSVIVPEFSKDGRPHVKEDALTVLKGKIDFCTGLLDSSKAYVESYYASADNTHVTHRFENPVTYLFFDSKEDFEAMKSPKNHYYYIEVDPSQILDEYHFILCCDRMDGSQDESIEFFNSPYPIIMLRENGTQNIVGILKPEDEENRSIKDARELAYRKYSAVLTG
ncbi:MAG: hypothetical protein H9W83_08070, partial [Leuconostoc sp.]|nr:hypothetical protein [Leuconostoc sp.]